MPETLTLCRDYERALQLYEQCSRINPKCPQAYVSLGYTHHLKFELVEALQYYHKAHFLKNEDSLIEELISKAMDDICMTEINSLNQTFLQEEKEQTI